jgi:hypothetical protein
VEGDLPAPSWGLALPASADQPQQQHEQQAENQHRGQREIDLQARPLDDKISRQSEQWHFAEHGPKQADEQKDQGKDDDDRAYGRQQGWGAKKAARPREEDGPKLDAETGFEPVTSRL